MKTRFCVNYLFSNKNQKPCFVGFLNYVGGFWGWLFPVFEVVFDFYFSKNHLLDNQAFRKIDSLGKLVFFHITVFYKEKLKSKFLWFLQNLPRVFQYFLKKLNFCYIFALIQENK